MKTNFDGIKRRSAEWEEEVYSREEKQIGMLKLIIASVVGFIILLAVLFPDKVIETFTK